MRAEAGKRLFTVEEFHRMGDAGIFDDDYRVELVDGEVFLMPIPGPPHNGDVDVLNDLLAPRLTGRAIVRVQGGIVLDDRTEFFPDLAVLRRRDDFYRRQHARPGDILLVIEVCDTSLRRDRRVKLPRYAAAGVPELWLVDINGSRIEVHRSPAGRGYAVTTVLTHGDSLWPEAFPDVVLQVSEILG